MDLLAWLFQFLFCFLQYQVASSSSPPFSPFAHPLCRQDQKVALLEFKHTLTVNSIPCWLDEEGASIPSYPKTSSWNEGNATDCCSWDGVTCDGSTGHVIGLDLSFSQLNGQILPNSSLFQLSHLQRLNLAHNCLKTSRISHSFGSFASLTHLNLSSSAFTGPVSSEISHLSKLISLDLSISPLQDPELRLQLSSFKILQNLTRLQDLVLSGVNLSSVLVPHLLTNMSSLRQLDLSWTGLQGHLPDRVFHLPNLQTLVLSYNFDLSINLPKSIWHNGSSLRRLDLSSSNLSGEIPYSIGSLKSLQFLDLSYTSLTGKIPYSIGYLKSLQFLFLSKTRLSGELPDSIGYLESLQLLDLSQSRFSIGSWTLIGTRLSGKLPDSIGYLRSLLFLSLGFCGLRGSVPKSLGNLTQIIYLNLGNNKFDGELPSTLSNLKQLHTLVLSSNNLRGKIHVLAELSKLEYLYLGDNNFIGEFPSWVANLKPLRSLDIWSNQLTGPIAFNLSGLQNLQYLSLSHNSLSGVIPPSLFTLSSLEDIDLSNNKLRGPIPQSISTLVNLTWLSLASNDLSGAVDQQTLKNNNTSMVARSNVNNTLPKLRYVYMSSCNLKLFPVFLGISKNLQELDLSHNRIHGQIPDCVGSAGKSSLEYLDLSHNFITGIKQLPWERLHTLDLRSNLLQGPLPNINSPSLRYLLISDNSLSGEISPVICNVTTLEMLDFSHNKLSGVIPPCLGNFTRYLSVLNLGSNRFEGTLPLEFPEFSNLRSLDLSGNQFEGPLPRSLVNCRKLEVLNVGNNKINDTFPHWLETLPELQVIVVRFNRFHGPINISKSKFPFYKLRIVDLSHNEFTGHLPARYFQHFKAMTNKTMPGIRYMGDRTEYYYDSVAVTVKGSDMRMERILTIFTTIDFSSNKFSGEIPNVIGNLVSLKVLNFSHNSLTGHIPSSLGDLESLESLDISSNQLTGRIPSQLTSLTFLEVLNVSWNRLQGPIPQGKQFNTFGNASYAGNSGLCGFPLSKECGDNNRTKVLPPVLQQEENDSYFDGFFWKIVAIGYGCGMTAGLLLGSLMFLIGRPKIFVRLAEKEMPRKVIRLRRTIADIAARRM